MIDQIALKLYGRTKSKVTHPSPDEILQSFHNPTTELQFCANLHLSLHNPHSSHNPGAIKKSASNSWTNRPPFIEQEQRGGRSVDPLHRNFRITLGLQSSHNSTLPEESTRTSKSQHNPQPSRNPGAITKSTSNSSTNRPPYIEQGSRGRRFVDLLQQDCRIELGLRSSHNSSESSQYQNSRLHPIPHGRQDRADC